MLELLGKGSSFIKEHTREDILLPVFADNEKTCDNQTGSHLGTMRKWVRRQEKEIESEFLVMIN